MAPKMTIEAELAPYLEQLRGLPFVKGVTVRSGRGGADALLRVTTPTGKEDLEVAVVDAQYR